MFITSGITFLKLKRASDGDGAQFGNKQASKSRKKKAPIIEGNKEKGSVHTKQVAFKIN